MSLQEHLWQDARHYAHELATYTSEEPLPWSDFLIQRARLLADIGEGKSNDTTRAQLTTLRAECVRMNTLVALPRIEAALRG